MRIWKLFLISGLIWFFVLADRLFPLGIVRFVIGIPFLLFLPGYSLLSTLRMDPTQRAFLSFALSVLVVTLIGFSLNFTPWGIKLDSVTYAIAIFTTGSLFIAWARQMKTSGSAVKFAHPDIDDSEPIWNVSNRSVMKTALFSLMVIVVLGAIASVAYFVASSKTGETFTSFSITSSPEGDYNFPNSVKVNQELPAYISITNHEGGKHTYSIQVRINGRIILSTPNIAIADTETGQQTLALTVDTQGENQKIEIVLFMDGQTYLTPLYLWLNVIP